MFVYHYYISIKFFKCIRNGNHDYFSSIISNLVPNHMHNTRFSSGINFIVPQHRLSSTQKSFMLNAVALWNSLPDNIKDISTLSLFKLKLKKYLYTAALTS